MNSRGRLLLVILLLLSLLILAYFIRAILLPFFIAITIAYLFHPVVDWLECKGLPRSLSILSIFALFFGTIAAIITFGMPKVIEELIHFSEQLPGYIQDVDRLLVRIQESMVQAGFPPGLQQVWGDTLLEIEENLLTAVRNFLDGFFDLLAHSLEIVLIPVMAYYFLRDWEKIGNSLSRITPRRIRKDVHFLAAETDRVLKAVVRGHLFIALIVGALTAIGMWAIGMKYSLMIGIIAGVADLIPYFGPIIGTIPVVILGLLQSPQTALWAVVVMFIIQQIESNLISPKVLGDSVGLHPLLVIFALLAGGHLFGLLGLLLAIPFAAVLKVIGRYIFLKVLV
ncbi:AI-2E family transporter [Heliorestis convoluta]|uniref:AI-2E family transporter n=1 Tax=Heliorestis convoluta TaxID=356322 RepID=A0A5Q2MWK9_9FIRM|nr:AI-2E family transporter [Heliorestis convoluta]QGG46717.1 AI-2E family transporter [Heliorestis convoluta]